MDILAPLVAVIVIVTLIVATWWALAHSKEAAAKAHLLDQARYGEVDPDDTANTMAHKIEQRHLLAVAGRIIEAIQEQDELFPYLETPTRSAVADFLTRYHTHRGQTAERN